MLYAAVAPSSRWFRLIFIDPNATWWTRSRRMSAALIFLVFKPHSLISCMQLMICRTLSSMMMRHTMKDMIRILLTMKYVLWSTCVNASSDGID